MITALITLLILSVLCAILLIFALIHGARQQQDEFPGDEEVEKEPVESEKM